MKYFIGIDIGGTNIKYGLVAENGDVISHDKVKTNQKGEEIIAAVTTIVKDFQKKYDITAVGLSVPGVVEESGFMTTGGSITDFYGIHLREILEERLSLPVYVENDANSAALAEKWLGSGKNYQHILCVVVGTGIGGGIIINNELFRGGHSSAGEFGFMVVKPIEDNDTRLATLSLTGSVQCGVVWPYELKTQGELTDTFDGEKVFNLANEGDQTAIEVIDIFYDRLALGIFNMAVSFDPEVVLIGGAISTNKEFMANLSSRVVALKAGHCDMANVILPEIKSCYFLNQAGIVGAVYRAIQGMAKEGKN